MDDERHTKEPFIIVRLACRTCGHLIPVRIGASKEDAAAIGEAVEAGRDHALVKRFCPFCMERHEFAFPVAKPGDEMPPPVRASVSATLPKLKSEVSLRALGTGETLKARATRLYREGVALMNRGEKEAAEKALRESADIFERTRLFRESGEAIRQLVRIIDQDPGRKEEAGGIIAMAKKRGLLHDAV